MLWGFIKLVGGTAIADQVVSYFSGKSAISNITSTGKDAYTAIVDDKFFQTTFTEASEAVEKVDGGVLDKFNALSDHVMKKFKGHAEERQVRENLKVVGKELKSTAASDPNPAKEKPNDFNSAVTNAFTTVTGAGDDKSYLEVAFDMAISKGLPGILGLFIGNKFFGGGISGATAGVAMATAFIGFMRTQFGIDLQKSFKDAIGLGKDEPAPVIKTDLTLNQVEFAPQ